MKSLIILSFFIAGSIATKAAPPPVTYKYVVKFNSECCGVPDAAPLLKSIASFKKKNKIKKISYYLISPMGREGEYYMAFNLSELCKKQRSRFIKEIDATVINMKDKGSCTTEQNLTIDKNSLSSRTTIIKKEI